MEYIPSNDTIVPDKEKHPKPPCANNCKFKCRTNFTDEERHQINQNYRAYGKYSRQRDFILANVTT